MTSRSPPSLTRATRIPLSSVRTWARANSHAAAARRASACACVALRSASARSSRRLRKAISCSAIEGAAPPAAGVPPGRGSLAVTPDPPGATAGVCRAGARCTALGGTEAGGGRSEYTIRPFASRHWYWAEACGAAASAARSSGSR